MDIGESNDQHSKANQCAVLDEATRDYVAALQLVLDTDSTSPIYWLGHSLGGQVFPLVDNIEQIDCKVI